ncbi:hypothetical protein ACJ8WG_002943 [Klebsiella pneumoniae]
MKANDERWLAVLRQMVSGHSTQANKIWEGLSQNQRGIILHAAGLKAFHCRYTWAEFSNRELNQIKRGLQRLKCLTDMFKPLGEMAYKQAPKPVATAKNIARPAAPVVAGTPIDDLIKARQQLRETATSRVH